MNHPKRYAPEDSFVFLRRNGSNSDDIFLGTAGRDVYNGRGGNDDILGNQGNDVLTGGSGKDGIFGGAGNDRIAGNSGADRLSGDGGTDHIKGGGGADEFVFIAYGSFLIGGSDIDIITDFHTGGPNADHVFLNILSSFGVSNFAQLKAGMFMQNGDTIINFGGGDVLVLEDVRIGNLHASNFDFLVT